MTERKSTGTSNTKQILDKLEHLTTVMIGSAEEDKPGLLERVRKLEDWVASEKKLIFLIVGVIITDIVTHLWALVVK